MQGRLSAPARWSIVGRTAMDYPALTTLVVLVVLSVVPFLQYANWVTEGEALAARCLELAEGTLDNGMSGPTCLTVAPLRAPSSSSSAVQIDRSTPLANAAEDARKAVDYYQRAWLFAPKRPSQVRLDAARAHLILAVTSPSESAILPELDEAAATYAALALRPDSQPEGLAGLVALCSVLDPGTQPCAGDAARPVSPDSLARYYYALLEIQTTLGDFDALSSTYRTAAAALPNELGRPVSIELLPVAPEANTYALPSGAEGRIPDQVLVAPFAHARQLVRISYQSGPSNSLPASSEFVVQPFSGPQTLPVSLSAGHPSLFLGLRQQLQVAVKSNDSAAFSAAAQAALRTGSPGAVNGVCWLGTLHSMAEAVMPACRAAFQNKSGRFSQDGLGLALAQVGQYDDAVAAFRAAPTGTDAHTRMRSGWITAAQSNSDPLLTGSDRKLLLEEVTGNSGVLGTYLTRTHPQPDRGV